MATTVTYTGRIASQPSVTATLSGDKAGQEVFELPLSYTFGRDDAPAVVGALEGYLSVTGAQDILLAHATDPLGATGSASYSEGFAPAGKELMYLRIANQHASASLLVERSAANGLPIFDAAGEGMSIGPGGYREWYEPAGFGALTTGSTDALTLSPSSGTVEAHILAFYKDV